MSALSDEIDRMLMSTQFWNESLDKDQHQRVQDYMRWARHTIDSREGIMWIARAYQRAFIYLSSDDKAKKKQKQFDAMGYSMTEAAEGLRFFASKNNPSQFKTVYEDLKGIGGKKAPVQRALVNLKYTDDNGRDRTTRQVYDDLNAIYSLISDLEKLPVGEPVLKFQDGSQWALVDTATCKIEGGLMKHCGNANPKNGDKILSYRVASQEIEGKHQPKLTFIYNTVGRYVGEMKGFANQKPDVKYHPYIVALLSSPNIDIDHVQGGGYAPERNFSLNDLDEKNFLQLCRANPKLIERQIKLGSSLDSYQKLDNIHLKLAEQSLHGISTARYMEGEK